MGIGFTIDTPLRVVHFGISSVVSIMDDLLIEKMRQRITGLYRKPYLPIPVEENDSRAKRITAYLNLLNEISNENFIKVRTASFTEGSDINKYFNLLPDSSVLKSEYKRMLNESDPVARYQMQEDLRDQLTLGDIDVNIMSKVDKVNYREGKPLPKEFNDAHAALRGFAMSELSSSVVFSAGMNPSLVDYTSLFDDFYPDTNGEIRKKIILKVSDVRSARIQSKYFAKKGLWVSEYRIESGLNCGGHAFATDGYLMGPILEDFKMMKDELVNEAFELLALSLSEKGRQVPLVSPAVKISAQGGVGTSEEHRFLVEHYKLNSVGWGSPFLLVPEVTSVDIPTLDLLKNAKEDDLYLSNVSPLGVPFNNIRGNTKDIEKEERIIENKPGSPCTNKYLASDTSYSEKPLCTASRAFQSKAIEDLKSKCFDPVEYQKRYNAIVEKSCICVGLTTSALILNELDHGSNGTGVSICPGPNIAYFSEILSLQRMVDHIYGRENVIARTDRPHMFIKELGMYLEHFKEKISQSSIGKGKVERYIRAFESNLNEGIAYYQQLFSSVLNGLDNVAITALEDLLRYKFELAKVEVSG